MSHPRGLYVLAGMEGWERNSFYLMLTLLAYYCNEKLGLSKADSLGLVGSYMGLIYLSAFPGGWLADKIGYLKAIFLGGFLMMTGHAIMAIGNLVSLYAGLGFLIVGNGLFKPSMSASVRKLYMAGDERIDSAFGIFYLAVNIGAGIAALTAGFLRHIGWHVAFGSAAIGLAIGLIQLYLQRKYVVTRDFITSSIEEELPSKNNKERISAIFLLSAIAVFFWMAFGQNVGTMSFWVRDCVDRKGIDSELFQVINPVCIILLTTSVSWVAVKLAMKTSSKIIAGMLFTALSYFLMAFAATSPMAHLLWPVIGYFTITIGELFVSPMGLSMIGKLAPIKYLAACMGIWYVFTAMGNKLAGKLGKMYWETIPHSTFFLILGITSIAAAILMYCGRNKLEKSISLSIKEE